MRGWPDDNWWDMGRDIGRANGINRMGIETAKEEVFFFMRYTHINPTTQRWQKHYISTRSLSPFLSSDVLACVCVWTQYRTDSEQWSKNATTTIQFVWFVLHYFWEFVAHLMRVSFLLQANTQFFHILLLSLLSEFDHYNYVVCFDAERVNVGSIESHEWMPVLAFRSFSLCTH